MWCGLHHVDRSNACGEKGLRTEDTILCENQVNIKRAIMSEAKAQEHRLQQQLDVARAMEKTQEGQRTRERERARESAAEAEQVAAAAAAVAAAEKRRVVLDKTRREFDRNSALLLQIEVICRVCVRCVCVSLSLMACLSMKQCSFARPCCVSFTSDGHTLQHYIMLM